MENEKIVKLLKYLSENQISGSIFLNPYSITKFELDCFEAINTIADIFEMEHEVVGQMYNDILDNAE